MPRIIDIVRTKRNPAPEVPFDERYFPSDRWEITYSLRNLCVLCVSVVKLTTGTTTETQRTQRLHREILTYFDVSLSDHWTLSA
jgi:hypothetical protein